MTHPPTLRRLQALAYERALMPEPRLGWLATMKTEPGRLFDPPYWVDLLFPLRARSLQALSEREPYLGRDQHQPC
jgi:hypothetical protein